MKDISALQKDAVYRLLEERLTALYGLVEASVPPTKALSIADGIKGVGDCYRELLRRHMEESGASLKEYASTVFSFRDQLLELDAKNEQVCKKREETESLASTLVSFAMRTLTHPGDDLRSHHAHLAHGVDDWRRKRRVRMIPG